MESHSHQDIDFSHGSFPLYEHQREGVRQLVEHEYFALFDEMGSGKTLQTIYAAQVLFERGLINNVLVITPASVRTVWYDEEVGELKKHLWPHIPCTITEYHSKIRAWACGPHPKIHPNGATKNARTLDWMITNYDFIRDKERAKMLRGECGPNTLMVLDESSAVKNWKSQQTKSCMIIRRNCGRVVLLNGTPVENNPGDLFSQGRLMNPDILACDTWFHFRARYMEMGGFLKKQVIGWRNIDDIQQRFAPYVLRRLKEQCLDLPEKLPPVAIPVALTPQTWSIYKEMKDELVAWLDSQTVAVSVQAGVKVMRLSQICSGFIGGVQDVEHLDLPEDLGEDRPVWIPEVQQPLQFTEDLANDKFKKFPMFQGVREIGREKLDAYMSFIDQMLEQDPTFKLLTWCRFRPELYRMEQELLKKFEGQDVDVASIHGAQKKHERAAALRLLHPDTVNKNRAALTLGTLGTGARGLNMAGAAHVMNVSNDTKLGVYLQGMDRVHRPGQTRKVWYGDLVATGPKGERTIDHIILRARQTKHDLTTLTCQEWVGVLMQE